MELLKFWQTRKLYVDIVLSFLVILIMTCISITWYTYYSNSNALLNLSDDLILQTSQSSVDKTISYLDESRVITELGGQLIRSSKDVSDQNVTLLNYMRWVIQAYPFLSSFYIGTQDGKFLQIRRLPPNSTYRADPTQVLPGGSILAVRFMDRSVPGQEIETWDYKDNTGKTLETEKLNRVLYDHRSRDWYINVVKNRSFVWSDIYVFNTNRKPGITAANPIFVDGQMIGVIAADIEISQISEFLTNSKIAKYGTALILSAKGEVVAHSSLGGQTSMIEGDVLRMLLVNDLKDPVVKQAQQNHAASRKDKFFFQNNDKDYLAYYHSFPGNFNKRWEIAFVVPVDAFIGAAKDTNTRIIFMSIVILVLSSFLILILAKRIAGPIIWLAKETTKIRNFDLAGDQQIKSSIFEIQVLNDAMVSMRQSMRTFSKFIPKILVSKLIKTGQDIEIGGKTRRATLLFSDVANFTTLSENYPPDKLVIHLSEYFEEFTQIIMHSNGIIDKFIGDAVMAFWGAPSSDRFQSLHACMAALHFKRRLKDLNRKWKFEGKPELPTRIGIHTGDVIIGGVGSSDRLNYTALGDTVNLASRLEGVNKMYSTEIIISEEVFKEVANSVLVRPLDVVAVKGKTKGVKIFELVGIYNDDAELLPSDDQIEFCKMFTKAFQLYLEQKWEEAMKSFLEISTKYGEDKTTVMYISRCKDFKKAPPTKDWDGVIHLKSK